MNKPVILSTLLIAILMVPSFVLAENNDPARQRRLEGGPFGIHGPTYSHWLSDNEPDMFVKGRMHLDVLRDTGARWARQDFWWTCCEPEPGKWTWDEFDKAFDTYEEAGINVYAILCYSAPWMKGNAPITDEDREQFGQYVFNIVSRYKDQVKAWEVWNEPNIQPFWSPKPDPELYTKLLQIAYTNAKKADPDCIVAGGTLAGPDYQFLQGMYEAGVKGYFDVLSYHNYGQELCIERSAEGYYKLINVMKSFDDDKPVWHTENGFYTGPVGLSEMEQGSRLIRYSVGLLALGIEKTFQLTLRDWTNDPNHHDISVCRGLLMADYTRKKAFFAYRTMCDRLRDKQFVVALRPAPGISGYLFENDQNEAVLVVWRNGAEEPILTPMNLGTPVVLTQTLMGDYARYKNPKGLYSIPVGSDPVYILNPGKAVLNQRNVMWDNPVETSLPRTPSASFDVTITNPTKKPLLFKCTIPGGKEVAMVGEPPMIPPGKSGKVQVSMDVSKADVGKHELLWILEDKDTEEVFAMGRRLVDVLPPLHLSFAPLTVLDPEDPKLKVRIDLVNPQPAKATLQLLINGKAKGEPKSIELLGGKTSFQEFTLDLKDIAEGQYNTFAIKLESMGIELSTETKKRLIRSPATPEEAKIDGSLAEYEGVKPQITPDMLSWSYTNDTVQPTKEDLQVTAWITHNDEGLWIAIRVEDDAPTFPKNRMVWEWDSIQIGIDGGADAKPELPFDRNDIEIEMGLNDSKGESWCYFGYQPPTWPAGQLEKLLQHRFVHHPEKGYTVYELLIPDQVVSAITKLDPNGVFAFSFIVNDNDGSGRTGWMELTEGIGMGKEPAYFDWLWLR